MIHCISIHGFFNYDPISFPCISLMSYLYISFIKLLFVFYCHASIFTVSIVNIVVDCSSTVVKVLCY